MRDDSGVAGEGRVVDVPKFHEVMIYSAWKVVEHV